MNYFDKFLKVVSLLEDRRSIVALLTWPKFSVASFLIVARLSRQGISPKTVLDLGANVGQFAVAAAKLFRKAQVHSFEPVPELADKLCKNVSRLHNVQVYPIAIGDSTKEIKFYVNSDSQVSSALVFSQARRDAFPDMKVVRTINVTASTLDHVLSDIDMPRPVLLKIDVQGYEDKVLIGAEKTLKKVDFILIETSFVPLYEGELVFTEILELVVKYGFKLVRPINWMRSPLDGSVLEMDILFARSTL